MNKCWRCKGMNGIPPKHCKGNPNVSIRIGEKSHILNCKCECNEFGKVQGNDKGHVKLTHDIVYNNVNKMRNKTVKEFNNRNK